MTKKTHMLGGLPARSKSRQRVQAAISTYTPNGTESDFDHSETTLKEQGVGYDLEVPDGFRGGSTHFRNVDTTPAEDPKAARLVASAEDDAYSLNTGTIPNDVSPAEDYLPSNGPNDLGQGAGMGVGAGGGKGTDIPNVKPRMDGTTSGPSKGTTLDDAFKENATELENTFDEAERKVDLMALNAEGIVENTLTNIGEKIDTGAILLDVDGVPDDAVEDVVLAVHAKNLLAIRANRIIATISHEDAVEAQIDNLYLTDEFDAAVSTELARMGLRAGLQNLGFKLARVDIGSDRAIQARVQASMNSAQANLDSLHRTRTQAFAQAMAIASVGTNRKFFKGFDNPLQEALIASLQAAGIRGAKSLVSQVFAKHGVSYANTLNQLANNLCELPQETRDGLAATLDLVDDTGAYEEEPAAVVPVGIGGLDDLEAGNDDFLPASLTAALSRPGQAAFTQDTVRLNASLAGKSTDKQRMIMQARAYLQGA